MGPPTKNIEVTSESRGGSAPTNNMQPTIGMAYFICYNGTVPTFN
ncbi:hypothetical protein [Flavobacterium sp. 3HN19-14]